MGKKDKGKDRWNDHGGNGRAFDDDDDYMGYYGHHGRVMMGAGPAGFVKQEPKGPPPPPPDPKLLAAMTDLRIYVGPESFEGISRPMTLLLTGKGLMVVRDTPIGRFVSAPGGDKGWSPIPDLPSPATGVSLKVPKLPWGLLEQTVAFFRWAHKTYGSEALVQFFWDAKAHGGRGEYIAYAPPQDVSGGGVHHLGHHDREGEMLHILDIHSHHTMGAFWSGTDDADEKRFEGRLFGVIGNIDKAIPQMKWRTRVGGAFVDLTLRDVVQTPGLTKVKVEEEFDPADLIETAQGAQGKANNRFIFPFDPFPDTLTFPKAWEDAIVRPFRGQAGRALLEGLVGSGFEEVRPGVWVPKTSLGSSPNSNGTTPGGSTSSPGGEAGTGPGGSGIDRWRITWVLNRLTGKVYFEGTDGKLWPSAKPIQEVMGYRGVALRFITEEPKPEQLGNYRDYHVGHPHRGY